MDKPSPSLFFCKVFFFFFFFLSDRYQFPVCVSCDFQVWRMRLIALEKQQENRNEQQRTQTKTI
jgi:hypothetical protein